MQFAYVQYMILKNTTGCKKLLILTGCTNLLVLTGRTNLLSLHWLYNFVDPNWLHSISLRSMSMIAFCLEEATEIHDQL